MSRAFIENGKWQGNSQSVLGEDHLRIHRRATLRGSALAALMTLALYVAPDVRLAEAMTRSSSLPLISAPEIVSQKVNDRVPSDRMAATGDVTSSFSRRKPRTDDEGMSPVEGARPFAGIEIGDRLTLKSGDLSIRLAGLALPDASMTCRRLDGLMVSCIDRASSYLELLVKGRSVACERAGTDGDGFDKGLCRSGGMDLAEQMIRQGWAKADDQMDQKLVLAETAARKQKLGIWRD